MHRQTTANSAPRTTQLASVPLCSQPGRSHTHPSVGGSFSSLTLFRLDDYASSNRLHAALPRREHFFGSVERKFCLCRAMLSTATVLQLLSGRVVVNLGELHDECRMAAAASTATAAALVPAPAPAGPPLMNLLRCIRLRRIRLRRRFRLGGAPALLSRYACLSVHIVLAA